MDTRNIVKTLRVTRDDPELGWEWVAWRQALALHGLGLPILPFSGDRYLMLDLPESEDDVDEVWLQRFPGAGAAVPLGKNYGGLIAMTIDSVAEIVFGQQMNSLPATIKLRMGTGQTWYDTWCFYRCSRHEPPVNGGYKDPVHGIQFAVMSTGGQILFHSPPRNAAVLMIEAPETAVLPDVVSTMLQRSTRVFSWDCSTENGADRSRIVVPEFEFA